MRLRGGGQKTLLIGLLLMALFLPLAAPAVWAADVSLRLELGSSQVEVGDRVPAKIIVEGRGDFGEPALPEVPGLETTFQGRAQSVQIINMQVKTSKIFTYVVSPQRAGEFILGPARLDINGSVLESNSVQLKVAESGKTQQPESTDKSFLIEASVDNGSPYVGQQVTLLFRFARTANAPIRNAGYELPDLPDFWTEGVENRREYSKNIDGKDHLVTEVAIPLFPTTAGDVTIGPILVRYEELVVSRHRAQSPPIEDPFGRNLFDDDFFKMFRVENIIKRTARTAPITLQVKPLPPAEKIDQFKGGVGKFSLSARLSSEEVNVGESVTLTLVLSGEGNIRDLPDPHVGIESVKMYSDTPTTSVKNYRDKIVGEKIYKLALVPQQSGQILIPQIAVPYFNPESERFEYASSNPLQLEVLSAEKETLVLKRADSAAKELIISGKTDILPIHERIGQMRTGGFDRALRLLRPVAYPLPLLMYAVAFVIARRRERLRTDVAYRRSRFAAKTAREYLGGADEAFAGKNWNGVFSKASKAVIEYLAAKLNVPSAGLTPAEMRDILYARGISSSLMDQVIEFLEFCDYGRFTSTKKSAAAAQECIKRARRLLDRLEDEEFVAL